MRGPRNRGKDRQACAAGFGYRQAVEPDDILLRNLALYKRKGFVSRIDAHGRGHLVGGQKEIADSLKVRRRRTAHSDAIPHALSPRRTKVGIGELPKSVELIGASALCARHPVGAVAYPLKTDHAA